MNVIIYSIFLTIEFLIVLTAVLTVVDTYDRLNYGSSYKFFIPYNIMIQIGLTLTCLTPLILLGDAIRRLRKCMIHENGKLAISSNQIFWHLGSFILFFLSMMLLVGILVNRYDRSSTYIYTKPQKAIQYTVTVAIVCLTLSELPILHILNSLVSKGI